MGKRLVTVSRGFERFGPTVRGLFALVVIGAGVGLGIGDAQNGLNAVIFVAFCFGLWQWALASWEVTIESWRAERLVRALSTQSIERASDALIARRGLFLALVRGLHRQHRTDPGSVDAGALLKALEGRLRERHDRATLTAQLLVTLGVLGTVVGLMVMMTGMSAAVQAAQTEGGPSLLLALFGPGGPLGGLGTAFSTTMFGSFLGGIVLRVLTSITSRSIARFVDHCDELGAVHIVPALRRRRAPEPDSGGLAMTTEAA